MKTTSDVDHDLSALLCVTLRARRQDCYWGAQEALHALKGMGFSPDTLFYCEGWVVVEMAAAPPLGGYLCSASHGWVEAAGRIVDTDDPGNVGLAYFESSRYSLAYMRTQSLRRLPIFHWGGDKKAAKRHERARRQSESYLSKLCPQPVVIVFGWPEELPIRKPPTLHP